MRTFWTLVIVIAVVAGLIWHSHLRSNTKHTSSSTITTDTFTVSVTDDTVSGPDTMKTTQGHQVVIHVIADVSDEVHLHGYDLHADVTPTNPVTITLTANTAGRFEMELENAKKTLSFLEVEPR